MRRPLHQPRGALDNPAGRFETYTTRTEDDGWWREEDLPPLRTTVSEDSTRTIIAKNDSPDIPFDQSINPYRGCEHVIWIEERLFRGAGRPRKLSGVMARVSLFSHENTDHKCPVLIDLDGQIGQRGCAALGLGRVRCTQSFYRQEALPV